MQTSINQPTTPLGDGKCNIKNTTKKDLHKQRSDIHKIAEPKLHINLFLYIGNLWAKN